MESQYRVIDFEKLDVYQKHPIITFPANVYIYIRIALPVRNSDLNWL